MLLVAQKELGGRRVFIIIILLLSLYLVGAFLPVVLGGAIGTIQMLTILIAVLMVMRVRGVMTIPSIFLLVLLVFMGMVVKAHIRNVFYQGRNFQRIPIAVLYAASEKEEGILTSNKSKKIIQLTQDLSNIADYDPNAKKLEFLSVIDDNLYYSIAIITHRFSHFHMLERAIELTPSQIPYRGLRSYQSLFLSGIPFVFWSAKPSLVFSNEFGRRYGFLDQDDSVTSVNVDLITEAWINGGFEGIFLSAAFLGIFFSLIYGWLNRGGNQTVRLLVVILCAASVPFLETESALVLGGVMQSLFIISAVYALVCYLAYSKQSTMLGV